VIYVITHKKFDKRYAKLRPNEQIRFKARRNLFVQNIHDPLLENHPLSGKHEECFLFHVGGDLLVLYEFLEKDVAHFLKIGTHHELFGC